MKTIKTLAVVSAFFCLPLFAAYESYLTIKGTKQGKAKMAAVNWGPGNSCASNEIHFTLSGESAAPFVQACRTNEVLPEVEIQFMDTAHNLRGAHVTACENNMFTIRFAGCTLHPKVAPVAASLLPPLSRLPEPNSQFVLDNKPAEAFNLLGFQSVGPTAIVLKTAGNSRLMQMCAKGSHFKDAKLMCRKAGKGQQEYLTVTLKEVFVSSVEPHADGSQSMTLNFARYDGSLAGFQDVH